MMCCVPSGPGCDGAQEDGCPAGEGTGTGPPGYAGDPEAGLAVPATGRGLLEELAPAFERRSTHALFMAMACGMILASRRTVAAMAAAAGRAAQFRRACWFFSHAAWDIDDLGLAVARLIVKYLLAEGEPVTVAVDGTFFRRWGRKVAQARWAYDGSGREEDRVREHLGDRRDRGPAAVLLLTGGAAGAVPALARQGHSLAGEAGRADAHHADRRVPRPDHPRGRRCRLPRPGPDLREQHVDDPAAGQRRAVWPSSGPGRQARPTTQERTPAGQTAPDRPERQLAGRHRAGLRASPHRAGRGDRAHWYGSFKDAPGQLVLVREPGSGQPYDLALFTLDPAATAAAVIERYSWRWPIEPSNATGKQILGVGEACNRLQAAVERTVPFGFLVQSLLICW